MHKEQKQIGLILTSCAFISLLVLLYLYTQNRFNPKIIHHDDGASLVLYASDGRHFYVNGKINNTTAEFMLDTGASNLAISETLAKRAGVRIKSQNITVSTANGIVEAQTGHIDRLEFGPYTLYDVNAFIVPNMSDQALLGMNILKQFNWSKEGNTLTLSPR